MCKTHGKAHDFSSLHDHFIVCGFGRVGRHASYEFQRVTAPFCGHQHTNPRSQGAKAANAGMLAVAADATHKMTAFAKPASLRAKGTGSRHCPSDAENLFIILSAKLFNPKLTVVTRASEVEAGEKAAPRGSGHCFYLLCVGRAPTCRRAAEGLIGGVPGLPLTSEAT